MEKIFKKFESLNEKAKFLQEAMVILPHKHSLSDELSSMAHSSVDLRELHAEIEASMKHHEEKLQEEYRETKQNLNRVQMKMMHLLTHLENDDQPGASQPRKQAARAMNSSVPETVVSQPDDESPMVIIKKPTAPVFEYEISDADYSKVPSYMKGRVAIGEVQEFLHKVFIRCFRHKYRIISQRRSNLKPHEYALQNNFRAEAKLFEGEKFITADDVARTLDRSIEKKHERFIQMLRHLQVIRECRKGSVCYYIWKIDAWIFVVKF